MHIWRKFQIILQVISKLETILAEIPNCPSSVNVERDRKGQTYARVSVTFFLVELSEILAPEQVLRSLQQKTLGDNQATSNQT